MPKRPHRPCPYRTTRKRRGRPTQDYCTAVHGGSAEWPVCSYCRDEPGGKARKPCGFRRKETRDGVTMDWCYAVGFERVGDLPCDNCETDKPKPKSRRTP